MSEKCTVCKLELTTKDLKDTPKCSECDEYYHYTCGGSEKWRKMTNAAKSAWKCKNCKSEASSTHSRSDNEQVGEKSQICEMIKQMNDKLDKQVKRFESMEKNYASLTMSYANLNTAIEGFKSELSEHKVTLDSLIQEKQDLACQVEELKVNLLDLQQYSRRNNLEVRGVPITPNEDIYEVVKSIANALDVEYDRHGISTAHRLRTSYKGAVPSIIIACVSRTTRDTWIAAAKQKWRSNNPLTTTNLRRTLPPGPVYVGEHLTPHNKMLLREAKKMVRADQIKYAWTSDGHVMVRKDADSAVIRVVQLSDLNKL